MANREYTRLEIEVVFDQVWGFWRNKDKGEKAPFKALTVAMRSGYHPNKIIEACRIYTLLHEGDEVQYTKHLNNFLNGDEWMDIIEMNSVERLEAQRLEAINLIDLWNQTCHSHWCRVSDPDTLVPLAKLALMNKYFKENFKKALDKASKIFQYSFNEKDPRSKLILSFKWFTNVHNDKHTVLKVMDGEFGQPVSRNVLYKTDQWGEPTKEQREQALKDWKEVFEDERPMEGSIPEIAGEQPQSIKDDIKATGGAKPAGPRGALDKRSKEDAKEVQEKARQILKQLGLDDA